MNPTLTAIQAAAIADHVRDTYGDDEDLVLGMVEGETDAGEYLDALIEAHAHDAAMIVAQKEWEAEISTRRRRMETRVKARREAMLAVMQAVDVQKWERPLATLGVSKKAPKRIVSDADALPDEFCRIERKPDMAAIKEADDMPPGVTMDNGGVSLTVRSK